MSLLFFTAKAEENISNGKHKYDFYGGVFDTIDKEGDEKANLFGFEHNNSILFRDTFVGKFSPITGGFITVLFIYIQVFKPNMV